MTTGALSSAIQDIITTTGWAIRRISIDPGSSLITAVEDTSGAVADLQDHDDGHQDPAVPTKKTRDLIKGLKNEGLRSKSRSVKLHSNKLKLNLLQGLPGTIPLTIVSFTIVVRRCAALLNSRPIAILPPSLSDPDEILSVSPSS